MLEFDLLVRNVQSAISLNEEQNLYKSRLEWRWLRQYLPFYTLLLYTRMTGEGTGYKNSSSCLFQRYRHKITQMTSMKNKSWSLIWLSLWIRHVVKNFSKHWKRYWNFDLVRHTVPNFNIEEKRVIYFLLRVKVFNCITKYKIALPWK